MSGLYWTNNYWIFMSTGYMWSPALSILLTKAVLKKKLNLGLNWISWKFNMASVLPPFFYCAIIYGIAYLVGWVNLDNEFIEENAKRFKMMEYTTSS